MNRVKIDPPYFPLTQQRLCCVPCVIQWILLRRGLKLIEQEKIGQSLNLTVPLKHKHLFVEKIKASNRKPKRGYGTQESDGSKINAFFNKNKIPLRVKKVPYSKIKDPVELISENLKKGNDIMAVTYMSVMKPKQYFGHALLISEIIIDKKPQVILGDPSYKSKKFWQTDLSKLIRGMDKKVGKIERGLYIFKSTE